MTLPAEGVNCVLNPITFIQEKFTESLVAMGLPSNANGASVDSLSSSALQSITKWDITRSFSQLFALEQGIDQSLAAYIPSLNDSQRSSSITPVPFSLVRLRCMIQDTHEPEYFISKLCYGEEKQYSAIQIVIFQYLFTIYFCSR